MHIIGWRWNDPTVPNRGAVLMCNTGPEWPARMKRNHPEIEVVPLTIYQPARGTPPSAVIEIAAYSSCEPERPLYVATLGVPLSLGATIPLYDLTASC